jgi:hypothetical protein
VTPDLEQTRQAIEGARALLPLLEARHGDQLGPIKDMVSQLQMAYAQLAGPSAQGAQPPAGEADEGGTGGTPPAADQPTRDEPERPSRLWVPGQ